MRSHAVGIERYSPPSFSATTCADCRRRYSAEEMRASHGWQPCPQGWRCPTCARAYEAMIDWFAHDLSADHRRQRWLDTELHRRYACMVCEMVRRARELAVNLPDPAWLAAARARNLDNIRHALLAAGDQERKRMKRKRTS